MHLIVCIDDRDGMSFCGKRLSSDKAVTEHILCSASDSVLWIHPYSQKLFGDSSACVDEDFLDKCGRGEYCFWEACPEAINPEALESVTLYCWNRRYPATQRFPREFLERMHLECTEDFPGNSHDKITVERYIP